MLPKPISYILDVQKILINADYEINHENCDKIKLFTANIEKFRFEYLRKKDLNSQMNIKIGDTNIIGYRYETDMNKKIKPIINEEHLIELTSKDQEQTPWSS